MRMLILILCWILSKWVTCWSNANPTADRLLIRLGTHIFCLLLTIAVLANTLYIVWGMQ